MSSFTPHCVLRPERVFTSNVMGYAMFKRSRFSSVEIGYTILPPRFGSERSMNEPGSPLNDRVNASLSAGVPFPIPNLSSSYVPGKCTPPNILTVMIPTTRMLCASSEVATCNVSWNYSCQQHCRSEKAVMRLQLIFAYKVMLLYFRMKRLHLESLTTNVNSEK